MAESCTKSNMGSATLRRGRTTGPARIRAQCWFWSPSIHALPVLVLASSACDGEGLVWRRPEASRYGQVEHLGTPPSGSVADNTRWSGRVTPERSHLAELARAAAERHGLDAALVFAVIDVESNWNPRARSYKDARGLMQLLPSTARRYGVHDPRELYHPETNLRIGTAHLRDLLDEFCDVTLALWAYHAGAHRVRANGTARYIRPAESRRYVRAVLQRYSERRGLSGLGEPDLRAAAGCADRRRDSPRLASSGASAALPAPVARIAHALVAGVQVDAGRLLVRVGEPVTLELGVVNAGGPARRGRIVLQLLEHPRLRLGYQTSMLVVDHSQTARGTVVEAVEDGWDAEAEHWLLVRLVPEDVGDVVLSYSATLDGAVGRRSTYPPGGSGRVVRIRVTRTYAGGN